MAEGGPAEVVSLLRSLASERGVIARGRLLAQGVGALRALSPGELRGLAIEVAERAAPELAGKLREHNSALSDQTVQDVISMARDLDASDLDDLATRIADPEWRSRAAADLGRAAAQTALPDLAAPHPPPPEGAPFPADEPETVGPKRAAPQPQPVSAPAAVSEPVARPPAPAVTVPRSAAGPSLGLPELEDWRARGVSPDQLAFTSPGEPRTSAPPARWGERESSWFGGADLGIAPLEVRDVPLAQRLLALERGGARSALLVGAAHEFAALDLVSQLGVLRVVPDGWARRRALDRLVTAGAVLAERAPRLLLVLERPTARAWVAATMVGIGLVELDAVAGVLDARAVERLRRRGRAS